jgi:hypothetical protein
MSPFGPWSTGISPAERLARLRSMRALALIYCRTSTDFISALERAETDADALPAAFNELECIPALQRRHLLATFLNLISRTQ